MDALMAASAVELAVLGHEDVEGGFFIRSGA